MRLSWLAFVGLGGSCGTINSPPPEVDASVASDAPLARCNRERAFGAPLPMVAINTNSDDHAPVLSPDELTIYFGSNRPGGLGGFDIYVATRAKQTDAFGTPVLVNGVNTTEFENRPAVTADGLTMYVESRRGMAPYHILRATRPSLDSSFGALQSVPDLTSTTNEVAPAVVPDHRAIYFIANRSGVNQIYRAERSGVGFSAPLQVAGSNLPGNVADYPAISADELVLLFPSNMPGGLGGLDIWMASRNSVAVGFGVPTLLAELSSAGTEYPGWLAPDGCSVYITRTNGNGGLDIFEAHRPPM